MRRSYKDGNAKCIRVEEQNVSHRNLLRTVWNTDASLSKPAKFEQETKRSSLAQTPFGNTESCVRIFRRSLAVERAEIFPLARSGMCVAGIQPIFAGFKRFDYPSFGSSFTSHLAGRVNRNSEPRPSVLSTLTLPPWASTNVFTIARPIPNPAV